MRPPATLLAVPLLPPEADGLTPWPALQIEALSDPQEMARVCAKLQGRPAVGLAVQAEPDGRARVAVAVDEGAPEHQARAWVFDLAAGGPALRDLWHAPRPPYCAMHDAQAAAHLLMAAHVPLPPRLGDVRIARVLLDEGTHRTDPELRATAGELLGLACDAHPTPPGVARPQAELAVRAHAALACMRALTPDLRALELTRVFELECRLVPAVVDMERAGIAVDAAAFQRIADDWMREREQTSDPARIARLDKLLSTYAHWPRTFVDLDGRIRCQLHPLAADSGRFSCTDPNLQQVPSTRTAPGLRACFRAAPGHRLVVADYGQIELRVAAHLAPDRHLQELFAAGADPHRTTAARLAGKDPADVTDQERKLAKAVNFGFLFGMGARRFRGYAASSYGVDLDDDQARAARRAFFRTFPGLARWHERTAGLERTADPEGVVVRTALGRRKRFLPGRFSWSAALNIPVQGTAAEGFKAAMIELATRLPELGGRGVLCVHDEYLAEVPADQAEAARDLVVRTMVEGMQHVLGDVPIAVDAQVAETWS